MALELLTVRLGLFLLCQAPIGSLAVQATSVTLMYENSEAPSSIKVTSGVSTQFTCPTSASRSTATIVWYIGTQKKQSSTSTFTFTPQESDHNKQVYCKAFNTQPESQAVSSNKATLDVQVQVTSVTLKDGNSEAPSSIQVTNGVLKTLNCTTSVSRPRATIIWFLSGKEQTRSNSSSNFTFTPNNNDHYKQIFCKAFNIQNESQIVTSHKATLYVQVEYTTALAVKGKTANISCFRSDQEDFPSVAFWMAAGMLIRDTSDMYFRGLTFIITNTATKNAFETFTCFVICKTALTVYKNITDAKDKGAVTEGDRTLSARLKR